MQKKLPWRDIQAQYPDQWVSLCDIEKSPDGSIQSAIVIAAGGDLPTVAEATKGIHYTSHQFKFTGTIKNFLGFARWTIDDASAH